MTEFWADWYTKNDPERIHFSIKRNESRTFWILRGEGRTLLSCATWYETLAGFYALMRLEDPLLPPTRLCFSETVRLI